MGFDLHGICFNCFEHGRIGDETCRKCGYDNLPNKSRHPMALAEGTLLSEHYIVGRVLGQGGFGITYVGYDTAESIKIAIKEYLPETMANRRGDTKYITVYPGESSENFQYGAKCFLDEAYILAELNGYRNIAGVRTYFEENNTAYFTMDYVEGISLKKYIEQKGGKLEPEEVLRILVPIMEALGEVHKKGIIHRDVTPENIYITKENETRLLDFGSARYSLGDKSKSLDVILKAGYAPKEQYTRHGKQGPFTDVYSLAACFYACISGYVPPESLDRMDEDKLLPLSKFGITLPYNLEYAVMKGLSLRPQDRFSSMEEFKEAIYRVEPEVTPVEMPAEVPLTPLAGTREITFHRKSKPENSILPQVNQDFTGKKATGMQGNRRFVSWLEEHPVYLWLLSVTGIILFTASIGLSVYIKINIADGTGILVLLLLLVTVLLVSAIFFCGVLVRHYTKKK